MDYNYHTHTYRCHHASGKMEQYVQRAIEGGIKYMGFSDHATFRYPDGYEAYYRVYSCDTKDYFDEAAALAEKYRDRISIIAGYEMEYFPSYFERMLKEAREAGAEYLILGQHYIGNGYPLAKGAYAGTSRPEELRQYVSSVVDAIRTGVFTYVAHPDIIKYHGGEEEYLLEMRKICEASLEYGVPLEINFLGIRTGRTYPNRRFWQTVGEVGSPVTFGFDAHDAAAAYDGASLATAEAMVREFGLNYIGRPEIERI